MGVELSGSDALVDAALLVKCCRWPVETIKLGDKNMAAKKWRILRKSAIFLAAIIVAANILLASQCKMWRFFRNSTIF